MEDRNDPDTLLDNLSNCHFMDTWHGRGRGLF